MFFLGLHIFYAIKQRFFPFRENARIILIMELSRVKYKLDR